MKIGKIVTCPDKSKTNGDGKSRTEGTVYHVEKIEGKEWLFVVDSVGFIHKCERSECAPVYSTNEETLDDKT